MMGAGRHRASVPLRSLYFDTAAEATSSLRFRSSPATLFRAFSLSKSPTFAQSTLYTNVATLLPRRERRLLQRYHTQRPPQHKSQLGTGITVRGIATTFNTTTRSSGTRLFHLLRNRQRVFGRRQRSSTPVFDSGKDALVNGTDPSKWREYVRLAGHIAFGIIALSYMVRDILWLRNLSIVASLLSIAYNYYIPSRPLWLVINWNILFILLNLAHVAYLFYERRDWPMTEEEEIIYHELFSISFPRNDFVRFIKHAGWETVEAGHVLFKEGEKPPGVYFIVDGEVTVWGGTLKRRYEIGNVTRGHFMGDMSYLLKDVSPVTVTAQKRIRYLWWDRAFLDRMSEEEVRLHEAFLAVLGRGLVADVTHYWLEKMKVQEYSALLQGIMLKGSITEEEKRLLAEYRKEHKITDEEEREALGLVGWTIEDYEGK